MRIRFSLLALWLLSSWLGSASSAQSIKPGSEIQVRLLSRLDTGNAQAGQDFLATLAQPVSSEVKEIWPKGTAVKGEVVEVVSSGRLQKPASITLQLTQIGNSPVETAPEQIDGTSHAGRNVAMAAASGKQEIVLPAETPLSFVIAGNPAPRRHVRIRIGS